MSFTKALLEDLSALVALALFVSMVAVGAALACGA